MASGRMRRVLPNAPRCQVRPASQRLPPRAARANAEGSGTANENTTPLLFAPPLAVIPYNVDPLSVKSPVGFAPWVLSKSNRVVGVPPVTGILKIVPTPFAPPYRVIPYNVDPLSVKLPQGYVPCVPSKEKRVVGVPPAMGILKMLP